MNLSYTIQLSISGSQIDSKCQEVIALLKQHNIGNSSVVPNKSIQCDSSGKCYLENGCRITLGTQQIDSIQDTLWKPLQQRFSLGCGFISIDSHYSGCVFDLWRVSNCPGGINSSSESPTLSVSENKII